MFQLKHISILLPMPPSMILMSGRHVYPSKSLMCVPYALHIAEKVCDSWLRHLRHSLENTFSFFMYSNSCFTSYCPVNVEGHLPITKVFYDVPVGPNELYVYPSKSLMCNAYFTVNSRRGDY